MDTLDSAGGINWEMLWSASPVCANLTDRQREVLMWVFLGEPSKCIAHKLGISEATVKIHRQAICKKTGARNMIHLILLVFKPSLPSEFRNEPRPR